MTGVILLIVPNEGEQYFTDKNPQTLHEKKVILGGKYNLEIYELKTREGAWNYTRGCISTSSGDTIFDVHCNYCEFNHDEFTLNGKDYMVVTPSYMRPVLLNLTDKTTIDIENNDDFCWISAKPSKSGKTLIVMGCYWGFPKMYLFYDLTCIHPDKPIPRLKLQSQQDDNNDLFLECTYDSLTDDYHNCASIGWNKYLSNIVDVSDSVMDAFKWVKKILYFPELNLYSDEAHKYFQQLHKVEWLYIKDPDTSENVKNYYRDLSIYTMDIMLEESIHLVRCDNVVKEVSHFKNNNLPRHKNQQLEQKIIKELLQSLFTKIPFIDMVKKQYKYVDIDESEESILIKDNLQDSKGFTIDRVKIRPNSYHYKTKSPQVLKDYEEDKEKCINTLCDQVTDLDIQCELLKDGKIIKLCSRIIPITYTWEEVVSHLRE